MVTLRPDGSRPDRRGPHGIDPTTRRSSSLERDVSVDRFHRVFRTPAPVHRRQAGEEGRPSSSSFSASSLVDQRDVHPHIRGEFADRLDAWKRSRCRRPVARSEGSSPRPDGADDTPTAGFIDPGWDGNVTLELSKSPTSRKIRILHGMKIGQISFVQPNEPAAVAYGERRVVSKYQGHRRGRRPDGIWRKLRKQKR